MNNHKILWKTSISKWIPIFICIVPLVVPSAGNIPYDDVYFQIYDDQFPDFMVEIFSSHQTRYNKIMPMLNDDKADLNNNTGTAIATYFLLNSILNDYDRSDSLLKEYPLISTAPLIILSSFIAEFERRLKPLMPTATKRPSLSCKVHNIMLDYRPRTVNARLEKLHVERTVSASAMFSESLSYAMSIQYNQYGYNTTIPPTIRCTQGCTMSVVDSSNRNLFCVKDDFGINRSIVYYSGTVSCITDYALLVRHTVEHLFPVDRLDELCVDPPSTTGTFDNIQIFFLKIKFKW